MRTIKEIRIRRALDAEWTRVLQEHYPTAHFPPPVLTLTDSSRVLGAWLGIRLNTIELSQRLVDQHPWYAVLEVYRHEMAHALTDFLHPCRDEGAHGPLFREICREIGANSQAVAEEISLDERVFRDDAPKEDSVTARVRKLLNLADNGGGTHEAETALCKAQELMAKYGMSPEELENEEYTAIALGAPVRVIRAEAKMLASLLQKFWPVQLIWALVPPPPSEPDGNACYHLLYVCGTLEHVRIASYVHDFIKNRIEQEFIQRYANRGMRSKDRREFTLGVLDGLYQALDSQTSQKREEYALILQKPAALREYYSHRYARVSRLRNTYDAGGKAFAEGRDVGEKMQISPGLKGSSAGEPRALPPSCHSNARP